MYTLPVPANASPAKTSIPVPPAVTKLVILASVPADTETLSLASITPLTRTCPPALISTSSPKTVDNGTTLVSPVRRESGGSAQQGNRDRVRRGRQPLRR